MKILFTFENPLPSPEADAEVFLNTAQALSNLLGRTAWLHVPAGRPGGSGHSSVPRGLSFVRAFAPASPAALRHFSCAATLVLRRVFREADLVYTRNLWIARWALAFGQRVVFDHYRPWADQIPPLQGWIRRILCHPRMLVHICHSEYTRNSYLRIGVPESRLVRVHNGYDPARLGAHMSTAVAKREIGVPPDATTVVYTGRINERKGLEGVLAAAHRLPEVRFLLVGSYGAGPVERAARLLPNVRLFPWQSGEALPKFLYAADMLLIPPSAAPLINHGVTVLPLKTFLYMGAGRAIIAGDTPDIREVLRHRHNAFLCTTDDTDSLVAAIRTLSENADLRRSLGTAALQDAQRFTWEARARRILELIAPRLTLSRRIPSRRERILRSVGWVANLIRRRSLVLPADPPANGRDSAPPD